MANLSKILFARTCQSLYNAQNFKDLFHFSKQQKQETALNTIHLLLI